MRRRACLLVVGIGMRAGGCAAEREIADRGDCIGRFEHPDGVTYDGVQPRSQPPTTGRVLGRGALLGCKDEVVHEGDIVELEGVAPQVAVAFDPDPPGQRTIIWSRPGYVVETPEHPLHDSVYAHRGVPPVHCGPPVSIRARSASTHRLDWIAVKLRGRTAADRAKLRRLGRRIVRFSDRATLTGMDRHGAPYVAAGDRLDVIVRMCDANEHHWSLKSLTVFSARNVDRRP
jgi:hypothetical protein